MSITAGLQIMAGQVPVMLSLLFLLGHDPFLAGQIATVVTLAIMNPDYTVNLFLTKNQLNPSQFGNKKCKLIVLLLFIAEAASHNYVDQLCKIQPRPFVYILQITYNY